jgi:hypothetical protein
VHRVAAAHVGGRGVVAYGLEGAGHRGGGDVGSTEVVHGGGVGPLGRDGGVRVEHALVGAGHGVDGRGVGVVEPSLGHVGGGDGGGAEEHGGTNAARVGADARSELLEVVDGVEHCSARVAGRARRGTSEEHSTEFGIPPQGWRSVISNTVHHRSRRTRRLSRTYTDSSRESAHTDSARSLTPHLFVGRTSRGVLYK